MTTPGQSILAALLLLGAAPSGSALAEESAAWQAAKKFVTWSDTSFSILPYGWNYKVDPSDQTSLTLEHVQDNAIGDLYMFVDGTWFHGDNGTETWFGKINPRLSLSKLFGLDLDYTLWKHGIFELKDVLVAGQYERGEEADEAEASLIGMGVNLDMREAGLLGRLGKFNFVQLNAYARNDMVKSQPNGFRDAQISMAAGYPFEIARTKWLIDGFFDWVLGIGADVWSFHFSPQIKLDVGDFWGYPGKLYTGVELDFWWNKYQIASSEAFDTNQDNAFSLIVRYHL